MSSPHDRSGGVRSHLYVPGDREAVLAKALQRGADALILDLEDAISPASKDSAREVVARFLADHQDTAGTEVWVRVNPGPMRERDLDAVVGPALTGICLAKAEDRNDLESVDETLSRLESKRGVAAGVIAVSALLETGGAVLRAAQIAAGPRVRRLQVGEADLCADLGVEPGPDERELLWARSQVVLASAAAGIEPPVGPVATDFRDLDRFRESTLALKRMGYRGRACIHPAQVAVVNDIFTPTADQVRQAREVVGAYEAAVASGDGVLLDSSGRMVDLAVVRAARRTLAAAR